MWLDGNTASCEHIVLMCFQWIPLHRLPHQIISIKRKIVCDFIYRQNDTLRAATLAHFLLLCSLWAKNSFDICKWLEKKFLNLLWHVKIICMKLKWNSSLGVHEWTYWKTTLLLFIQYCSRLLSHHSSTVVKLQQRLHVPAKMKIFTNWPFTGKVCWSLL